MKNKKTGFKNFVSLIWKDFIEFIKKHWLKFISFLCCFVIPVVVLLAFYVQKVDNTTKYVIPFAVIIPLVILILIYWGKAKAYFSQKLLAMKVQNSIDAGKYAGAIIVFDTVKALMTVLPFALCYVLVNEIQKYFAEVSKIFLFITICEAVGGFFAILDTIHTVNVKKDESNE